MSRGIVLGVACMLMASVIPVNSKPQPSEPFDYQAVLSTDDTYHLFWKFDEKNITFEVHVKSKGYVGFGLSPDGSMKGSDIVIGWVKDGKAYFQDRFAEGNRMPTVDPQQDWELLSGIETDSYTILKFRRELVACDTRDRTIRVGTMRVIWAYHQDDPDSEDRIPYHEEGRRGAKSIYLLQQVSPPSVMPPDVTTYDFLVSNVTVPAEHTFYWCHEFMVPRMTKHHIIKMEPVLQEGNEKYLHHMTLYKCHKPSDSSHNMSALCFTEVDTRLCTVLMYVWINGGEGLYLPAQAGMSFGGEDQPGFYTIQVHYNNPMETPGIIDNSGLRFTITPTIRTYDVGIMYVGGDTTSNLVIPPEYESLRVRRICSASCLAKHIPDEGIKVFAGMLHAHFLGVELQFYHFRNGEQLQDSDHMADFSYDTNYQAYRVFDEITVLKNDTIVLDCVYDSRNRSGMTYGGFTTADEMCIGYLVYYPKMDLTHCASFVLPQYQVLTVGDDVELNAQGIVEKPDWLANRTWTDVLEKEVDWKQSLKRQTFQDLILTSDQLAICIEADSNWKQPWVHIIPGMNVTRNSKGFQECNAGAQMAIKYSTLIVSTLFILESIHYV